MRPSLKNNHPQRAGPQLVGIEIELKLNINLLRGKKRKEKKKKNIEFTQSIIAKEKRGPWGGGSLCQGQGDEEVQTIGLSVFSVYEKGK